MNTKASSISPSSHYFKKTAARLTKQVYDKKRRMYHSKKRASTTPEKAFARIHHMAGKVWVKKRFNIGLAWRLCHLVTETTWNLWVKLGLETRDHATKDFSAFRRDIFTKGITRACNPKQFELMLLLFKADLAIRTLSQMVE